MAVPRSGGAMRRRRRGRNLPLTVRIGGRKHTWRALVKRYGVRGAKRKWRSKKKKYHGRHPYDAWWEDRDRRRRKYVRRWARRGRRRRCNAWRGQSRRHARAARKSWLLSKHAWRALVKRYGVRGAKRHGYTRTRAHNRRRRSRRVKDVARRRGPSVMVSRSRGPRETFRQMVAQLLG